LQPRKLFLLVGSTVDAMSESQIKKGGRLGPLAAQAQCTLRAPLVLRSSTDSRARLLLEAMLQFIDDNISDPCLRPGRVAKEFTISTRYLHKIFSYTGVTFASCVGARRLEAVHRDLVSGSQLERVSTIASRWGFRDISSFNRAFKRRFGSSPREIRLRSSAKAMPAVAHYPNLLTPAQQPGLPWQPYPLGCPTSSRPQM